MNGKTGSRLIARVRPYGGATASFQRDVPLLAAFAADQKHLKSVVWVEPSDGTIALPIIDFAPSLYVDCARRVRLIRTEGRLEACYATSTAARIASDDVAGRTGDPYAPMKQDVEASVTPKRKLFSYRGCSEILESKLPVLATIYNSDLPEGLSINLSALIRRGGTDTNTDGFFDRSIRTIRMGDIASSEKTPLDRIGRVTNIRAREAGEAWNQLRVALFSLMQGGPKEPRLNDESSKKKVGRWLERFDDAVTTEFFDAPFWSEAAGDPDNHRLLWRTRLYAIASDVFGVASEAAPRTEVRRVRAKAKACSSLDIDMKNWIKKVRHGE